MEIRALGDSALIIHPVAQPADRPERTLAEVLGAKHRIESARIPGVIECASAYTTVAVFFDPAAVIRAGALPDGIFEWLGQRIGEALASRSRHKMDLSRLIEVPACFDDEFALDLEKVAGNAGISSGDVIKLYCAASYRVSCIGFTPGFPYLSGLPKKLATPRQAVPRKEVAAGSVAIGGGQAGIYPLRSPGGWNVIGRTPLRLFDPANNPPALLRAGDRVRFRVMPRDEFEAMKN